MLITAAGLYGVNVTYYATVNLHDSTKQPYLEHSSSERVQGVIIDVGRQLDLLFLKFYW